MEWNAHIENGKRYRIKTDQADSEVILIQDRTVYYRVSDEIFKADMTDKGGLTPPVSVTSLTFAVEADPDGKVPWNQ